LPPSAEHRSQAFFLFTKQETLFPVPRLQFFGYTCLRWERENKFADEFRHAQFDLPENNYTWFNMIVVSDSGSEPLGILVEAIVAPGETTMQLWQCIQNSWRKISIIGNTPKKVKALLSPGRSQCRRVGHEIFLMGTTEDSETAGTIFMFNLLSQKWRKVQRPDGMAKPVAQTASVDGTAIALLSTDMSFISENLDNECVPKVSLGFFEQNPPRFQNSSTSNHGSWSWSQDVVTQDECGYIFKGKQGSAVQTENLLLVLGFGVPDKIMKAGGQVAEKQDIDVEVTTKPTLDALDLGDPSSLSWRGVQVDNSWIVYPYFDDAIMLNDSDSNTVHLITSSFSGSFRFYSLRNTHLLEKCYTKKVKQDRLDAEKRSLSHQIQLAEKDRFKSYLGCSWCRSLEVESVPKFLTCGRCGDPKLSYCSKDCQINHWNAEHKEKCKETNNDTS